MSKIDFNTGPAQINPAETIQSGPAGPSAAAFGTPPASAGHSAGGVDLAALGLPTLPTPPAPSPGPLSLEQLVNAIGYEGRKLAVQQGVDAIKAKAAEIKQLNEDKIKEIQKQIDALEEQKKLSPWARAFKWIGMIVGVIASVAGVVAGIATGNPLLAIGSAIALVMSINSIVSEVSGGKVSIGAGIAALAVKCGADEELAKKIGSYVEIGLTAVAVLMTLGGGIGQAMGKLGQAAATASEAVNKAIRITSMVSAAGNIVGGGSNVAQGSFAIVIAEYDQKIAYAKADMKNLEAILERIQTAMKVEEDLVESVMKRTEELLGKVKDIVMDNITAQTAILTGGKGAQSLA